ncbi:MAG: amidohydrolase, partial [Bacteroidota bacterium]
MKRFIIASLSFFFPLISTSQDIKLEPVSNTYVLKNVNITQAPGRKIDLGMVVIRDGVIKAVGKSVSIPADARVIEADSMYVYAGFISGLSHAGVPKPKDGEGRPKVKDPGNPPNEVVGITPQLDVRDALKHTDKSLKSLREVGFTAAQVVPYG